MYGPWRSLLFACEDSRMGHTTPDQTPEGRLIEQAATYSGRSARALSANAGMSDTRWRQVVRGWQPGPAGTPVEARASAVTLARMALAVGVSADQLTEVGREDAAVQLQRIEAELQSGSSIVPLPSAGVGDSISDEIELIYEAKLPAKKRLELIRKVLLLRREAEAEEAAERKEAAARAAGNGEENATSPA
jgi:hypothetical protein